MKKEFEFLNEVEMDFSKYEECKITEMERYKMKKSFKERKSKKSMRTAASTAACLAALLVFSQTSIAKAIVEQIIAIGHSEIIVETETDNDRVLVLPEEMIGQVFDDKGNELTELTADQEIIYNKDGEEIYISEEDGVFFIHSMDEDSYNADELEMHFTETKEMDEVLSFELKLPTYLPEGYDLVDLFGYKDEEGNVSTDYAVLIYGNGDKKFTIHERRDSEETSFVTGMTNVQEVEFAGTTAVYNDTEFHCTWDEVTVSVLGGKAISGNELLKIAKSME